MPVATVPAYDEMWVHPQVVAALSAGFYTYVEYPEWNSTNDYPRNFAVIHGDDAPYGGYVWVASTAIPAGAAPPGVEPTWILDQAATAERLRLFTATTQATWLLDTLTQYTLHGIEHWAEDYQVHTSTIRMRRFPVIAVHSVIGITRCNVAGSAVGDWCWKSAQQISLGFVGGQPIDFWPGHIDWPSPPSYGCNNVVRVVYTIGSNLPPGTEALSAWLAVEYGKASTGQACALPERVSSVTRQGVSWTVLDPQDFLDKGYTGMSKIDHWLAPVKLTIGGQLIDPLTSHLLFSTQVFEGDVPEPSPVMLGYGEGFYGIGPYGGTS